MHRATAIGRLVQIKQMLRNVQEECLDVQTSPYCQECAQNVHAYIELIIQKLQTMPKKKKKVK